MLRLALHFGVKTRCRNCDVDGPQRFSGRVEHRNSYADDARGPLLKGIGEALATDFFDLLTQDLDRMDGLWRHPRELNTREIFFLKITWHVRQDGLAARGRVKWGQIT